MKKQQSPSTLFNSCKRLMKRVKRVTYINSLQGGDNITIEDKLIVGLGLIKGLTSSN